MIKIAAVLFDLDQTLLDRDRSLDGFLDAQWTRHDALHGVAQADFKQRFIEQDANGLVWKDVVYARLLAEFGVDTLEVTDMIQEYLDGLGAHACLFDGVLTALQELRAVGLKLGIITNGRTDLQSRIIAASGLDDLMDSVVISGAVGVGKPDPGIFNIALKEIGLNAGETVFVGDNPIADIAGARALGMGVVWKQNNGFDAPSGVQAFDGFAALPRIISGFDA